MLTRLKGLLALGTAAMLATPLALGQTNQCPAGSLGGFIVSTNPKAYCLTDPKIAYFGPGGDLHLSPTVDYPMPPYSVGDEVEVKAMPAWTPSMGGRPLFFGGSRGTNNWPPSWTKILEWESNGLVSITLVSSAGTPRVVTAWGGCSASCGSTTCGTVSGSESRTCTPGTGGFAHETCTGYSLSRSCSRTCGPTCVPCTNVLVNSAMVAEPPRSGNYMGCDLGEYGLIMTPRIRVTQTWRSSCGGPTWTTSYMAGANCGFYPPCPDGRQHSEMTQWEYEDTCGI